MQAALEARGFAHRAVRRARRRRRRQHLHGDRARRGSPTARRSAAPGASTPSARVVVTGCWAQTEPGEVARAGRRRSRRRQRRQGPPARRWWRSSSRPRGRACRACRGRRPARRRGIAVAALRARPGGRSRAFVKVQDGCQHRCAFCIVPLARGASRSLEPEVVADQVRLLVEAGHPEVMLTGVDLGHYGADLTPRTTLAALLPRPRGDRRAALAAAVVDAARVLHRRACSRCSRARRRSRRTSTCRCRAGAIACCARMRRPYTRGHVPPCRRAAGRRHPAARSRRRRHRRLSRRDRGRLRARRWRWSRRAAVLVPARVPVLRPEGDGGRGPAGPRRRRTIDRPRRAAARARRRAGASVPRGARGTGRGRAGAGDARSGHGRPRRAHRQLRRGELRRPRRAAAAGWRACA